MQFRDSVTHNSVQSKLNIVYFLVTTRIMTDTNTLVINLAAV